MSGALTRRAAAQGNESILARVKRTRSLRVGAVNGQPPYCYKDLATGEWAGFMIDSAKDLAGELGAAIAPVESTWGNAALDVQAGKVDIFLGLAPTPQRALVVDFTRPLFENAFALVARAGFAPRQWSDLDRPDIRVALELGTVYDQNVAKLCPNASITRTKTNNDALLMIQSGHADCQIIVVILALTTLARNASIGHLVVPEPLFGSSTCAMMAKEATPVWRDTVDDWIARRRSTGWLRQTLVANLVRISVREADVPPQLLF
jgi:polar amino acid transport system substrate-binding protein